MKKYLTQTYSVHPDIVTLTHQNKNNLSLALFRIVPQGLIICKGFDHNKHNFYLPGDSGSIKIKRRGSPFYENIVVQPTFSYTTPIEHL